MPFAKDPIDWIDVAAGHAHRPFLKLPNGPDYRYAELLEQSGRIASALIERGVEPGDRVATQIDKSADAIFLYVSCLRLGALFLPLNAANTPNEVEHFLRDSQPRLAVIRPQDRILIEPLARRAEVACVETLRPDGGRSLLKVARPSAADF